MQLGAVPAAAGGTDVCVWAPNATSVSVRGQSLEPAGEGFFAARLPLRPGEDYRFTLGGVEFADPCSREQPGGLRGPSRVLDTGAFSWSADPVVVPLGELVVYELHVGTFTPEGTFDAAIPRLDALAELGVTAIELMPVATFPGERGWGYDGVDVVYNHVGPGSELASFGPYFTDRFDTFWGDALDYSQRGVREWAIQNAELWVRDYRIDGLSGALVIAEMAIGDRRPLEEWGDDAQWADEFHHALHVLLTDERDGYYADFGTVADLARPFEDDERLVVYAQNHDQVGNRAHGDRLPPETRRLAAACVLFAPQIPLLFMGDEYGETAPFQFFTDHDDPALAEATREGRKQEFAKFDAFRGEVPDPQDPATFERSKLEPEAGDDELRAFYAELISLRRSLPHEVDTDADESRRVLRVRRGDRELVADFAGLTAEIR